MGKDCFGTFEAGSPQGDLQAETRTPKDKEGSPLRLSEVLTRVLVSNS